MASELLPMSLRTASAQLLSMAFARRLGKVFFRLRASFLREHRRRLRGSGRCHPDRMGTAVVRGPVEG